MVRIPADAKRLIRQFAPLVSPTAEVWRNEVRRAQYYADYVVWYLDVPNGRGQGLDFVEWGHFRPLALRGSPRQEYLAALAHLTGKKYWQRSSA